MGAEREAYPNDPIKAAMWLGFLRWAYTSQDEYASGVRQQYEHETGRKVYYPRAGIEGMIDQATGYRQESMEHFMHWLNEAHWGEDPFTGEAFPAPPAEE